MPAAGPAGPGSASRLHLLLCRVDLMLPVIIPGACWVWALCRARAGSGQLLGLLPCTQGAGGPTGRGDWQDRARGYKEVSSPLRGGRSEAGRAAGRLALGQAGFPPSCLCVSGLGSSQPGVLP